MDDSQTPVEIPADILRETYLEARKAFPSECCGWLSGSKDSAAVSAIRPCVNDQDSATHSSIKGRTTERAYNISGKDQLELALSIDGDNPARVIFHSHPNGGSYFSDADRAVATWGDEPSYPVQHLVVGITQDTVVDSGLFAWSNAEKGFVEIARFNGADI